MMDKERLIELREETTQYRAVADDRCMHTQYEDDLLTLIDAEIARQSVTDEQIRTALDYVNDYKKEAMAYDTSVGIFPPTSEEVRAWETVETALHQYQKPTDEAVHPDDLDAAIEDAILDEEAVLCMLENVVDGQHTSSDRKRLIEHTRLKITALRQMRSEPCEWCDGKEDSLLVWTKDPCEIEWDNREYTTRGWTWKELKPKYCPNCGRKLVN